MRHIICRSWEMNSRKFWRTFLRWCNSSRWLIYMNKQTTKNSSKRPGVAWRLSDQSFFNDYFNKLPNRVGMKNMWQSFDVGVKNCSKLVMRLTEPTSDTCETGGTYFSGEDGNSGWKSYTGIKIKFGIRRIKSIFI